MVRHALEMLDGRTGRPSGPFTTPALHHFPIHLLQFQSIDMALGHDLPPKAAANGHAAAGLSAFHPQYTLAGAPGLSQHRFHISHPQPLAAKVHIDVGIQVNEMAVGVVRWGGFILIPKAAKTQETVVSPGIDPPMKHLPLGLGHQHRVSL